MLPLGVLEIDLLTKDPSVGGARVEKPPQLLRGVAHVELGDVGVVVQIDLSHVGHCLALLLNWAVGNLVKLHVLLG